MKWEDVAAHPIHSETITNGHAARMRWSRLKKQLEKQLEGTPAVQKPRNPASPRKTRVEKNKSPKKIKDCKRESENHRIKMEAGEAGAGRHSLEGTPEAGREESQHASPMVKREPGMSGGYPLTPVGSQGQTPSPGFGGNMSDINEMMVSFGGLPSEQGMYSGVGIMDEGHGYGMGMQMGIQDPYANMWSSSHTHSHEAGAGLVKSEPRWEESYRQI